MKEEEEEVEEEKKNKHHNMKSFHLHCLFIAEIPPWKVYYYYYYCMYTKYETLRTTCLFFISSCCSLYVMGHVKSKLLVISKINGITSYECLRTWTCFWNNYHKTKAKNVEKQKHFFKEWPTCYVWNSHCCCSLEWFSYTHQRTYTSKEHVYKRFWWYYI